MDLAESDENGNENERGNGNGNERGNGKDRQRIAYRGIYIIYSLQTCIARHYILDSLPYSERLSKTGAAFIHILSDIRQKVTKAYQTKYT